MRDRMMRMVSMRDIRSGSRFPRSAASTVMRVVA
jgi:hypothetical protein